MAKEFLSRLVWCEPSVSIQAVEAVLIAVVLELMASPFAAALNRFFKTRPWFEAHRDRVQEVFSLMTGTPISKSFAERSMGMMVFIGLQHLFGGLLAFPAVFGLGLSTPVAHALVRHGALIELGWEFQDTFDRLWERFMHPDGAKLQPWAVLKMLFIHHAMQWSMVIPMNLYYSHLPGYHELVLLLENAAGFAIFAQFNGFCCDISKRHELRQMVIWCALTFLTMAYTRVLHYWWSVFKVLSFFYRSAAYVELAVGLLVGVFTMPYIALKWLPQSWIKLVKFWKLYQEGRSAAAKQQGTEQPTPAPASTLPDAAGCLKEHDE